VSRRLAFVGTVIELTLLVAQGESTTELADVQVPSGGTGEIGGTSAELKE
jgi:hypothetical protein